MFIFSIVIVLIVIAQQTVGPFKTTEWSDHLRIVASIPLNTINNTNSVQIDELKDGTTVKTSSDSEDDAPLSVWVKKFE